MVISKDKYQPCCFSLLFVIVIVNDSGVLMMVGSTCFFFPVFSKEMNNVESDYQIMVKRRLTEKDVNKYSGTTMSAHTKISLVITNLNV